MNALRNLRFDSTLIRQRGQAALLTVLFVFGITATVLVYTLATPAKLSIESDKKTAAALAQAKEALIGRAAADSNRPGSLPCPDIDNDGDAESPVAYGGVCPSYIGHFPWKTLGLPDLRDGSGERLWYALTPSFRDHSSGGALNSDTPGLLTINGTFSSSGVIAILFAPGPVVSSQVRDTANQNNAASYLEGGNETGIASYTFVTGQTTATFNDKLLEITSDALFSVVEMRVLREMRKALIAYQANPLHPYLPGANSYSDATYSCDLLTYQGRLPLNINLGCTALMDWTTELPSWFGTNNWQNVTYYAVSPCKIGVGAVVLGPLTALCANIGQLSADGVAVDAVVFTAGRRLATLGQNSSCASVSDCLEGTENTNEDGVFVSPARSATNNDRILIVLP